MEIKCKKCSASLLKSYGGTYKLRSRSIRWDDINGTATIQCNMCRSFNEAPLELRVETDKFVIEVGKQIKKSQPKEKLIITDKAKNSEKKQ